MQQIKIFFGSNIPAIQSDINSWLFDNGGITILKMTQSQSENDDSWGIVITILYQES